MVLLLEQNHSISRSFALSPPSVLPGFAPLSCISRFQCLPADPRCLSFFPTIWIFITISIYYLYLQEVYATPVSCLLWDRYLPYPVWFTLLPARGEPPLLLSQVFFRHDFCHRGLELRFLVFVPTHAPFPAFGCPTYYNFCVTTIITFLAFYSFHSTSTTLALEWPRTPLVFYAF